MANANPAPYVCRCHWKGGPVMPIATFLSHSVKNRQTAGTIKEALECCGFDVFVAHDSIKVSEDWEREILRQLKRCKVFIALLTKAFATSKWANQEAGAAVCRNAILVSIKAGIRPPAFLARRQYVPMSVHGDETHRIYRTCSRIAASLGTKYARLREDIRSALVANVTLARNYYAAEAILLALEEVPGLTPGEMNLVARGARLNDQVRGAYIAGAPFSRLIAKHQNGMDPAELGRVKEVFGLP